MQPVQPTGSFGPIRDQPGVLEKSKVAGDGGSGDRQAIGQLLNRTLSRAQQLDDGASIRVPKGVEWVTVAGLMCDCDSVTRLLP